MKNKLNQLGISLIECMIVVIIICVTVVIWKFSSSGHIKIAELSEGRMLVEKIIAQEKIYRASNFEFDRFAETNNNNSLGINTKENKYFLTFSADTEGPNGALRALAYAHPSIFYGGAKMTTIVGTYIENTNEIIINEIIKR